MRAWLALHALVRGARAWAAALLWAALGCCWRPAPTLARVLRAPPGPQQTRAFARLVRGDTRVAPGAHAGLFGGDSRGSLEHAPSAAETAALLQARWGAAPGDAPALALCVARVRALTAVRARCEALRATPFDSSDAAHEAMLEACWTALRPGLPRSGRISKDWQALGFQGDDPATDFRASGELGLRVLHHLAQRYAAQGAAIIDATSLPEIGYPLALALIHATMLAMRLLASGHLDACLDDGTLPARADVLAPATATGEEDRGVRALLDVACRLLLLLDDAWAQAAPRSVMEFERVFSRWAQGVRDDLERGTGLLPVPRRLIGRSS